MKRDKLRENSLSLPAPLLPRHHLLEAKEKTAAKRNPKFNKQSRKNALLAVAEAANQS